MELPRPADQQQIRPCHRRRQRGRPEAGRTDASDGTVLRLPRQGSRVPTGRSQHCARVRTHGRRGTHCASRGGQGLVHWIHGGRNRIPFLWLGSILPLFHPVMIFPFK